MATPFTILNNLSTWYVSNPKETQKWLTMVPISIPKCLEPPGTLSSCGSSQLFSLHTHPKLLQFLASLSSVSAYYITLPFWSCILLTLSCFCCHLPLLAPSLWSPFWLSLLFSLTAPHLMTQFILLAVVSLLLSLPGLSQDPTG